MKQDTLSNTPLMKSIILALIVFSPIVNATPLITNTTDNVVLSLDTTISTDLPNYIDFDRMKPVNTFKLIQQRYLTFYSTKTEKVKATYLQGAYAINYTQKW